METPKSRIPPQAACVHKGPIFEVYQWQQELYDGTTATFEMLKRPNTVLVLATADNHLLLAHQEQPGKGEYYDYLGGRADEGEAPLDTAKRELLEESGMVSDDWELWHIDSFPGKIEWHTFYFIARNCQQVAEQRLDAGEKLKVVRVLFDAFINDILPNQNFADHYTRRHIFSLYNAAKAGDFQAALFKKD